MKTTKQLVAKLKKEGFEDNEIDVAEAIVQAFRVLENEGAIDFYVDDIASGSDYWLQVSYYSDTIDKSIIWDYDFQTNFENLEELVKVALETQEAINKFEFELRGGLRLC